MTTSSGHPLARAQRRFRRLVIAVETIVTLTMIALLVLTPWSWWSAVAAVFTAALMALLHPFAVDGFSIDEHDQPITGRDADELARWKMKLRRR